MSVTAEMMDPDAYGSLGELLADALVQFKSETALIEVDRKKERHRLTYLEVRREVGKVARFFAERSIGPGDRVAVLSSNWSRWLISAMAVFHRGAVLVPLDYKLSPREQLALLAHCRPAALVSERGQLRRFEEGALDVPLVFDLDDDYDALPDAEAPPRVPRGRGDVATDPVG